VPRREVADGYSARPQWLGPLGRARARAIARSDMVDIPRPSYA